MPEEKDILQGEAGAEEPETMESAGQEGIAGDAEQLTLEIAALRQKG